MAKTKKSKKGGGLLKAQSFKLRSLLVVVLSVAVVGSYLLVRSHAEGIISVTESTPTYGYWYKDSAVLTVTYDQPCFSAIAGISTISDTSGGEHSYRVWANSEGDPFYSVDDGSPQTFPSMSYCNINDTAISGIAGLPYTLYVDNAPPVVSINGLESTQNAQITVTGTVSDSQSGVASVQVNGVTASLSGGTFSATVPVNLGSNTITAVATDNVGHTANTQTSVTRTNPPAPAPAPAPAPSPAPTSSSTPKPSSSSSSSSSNKSTTSTNTSSTAAPIPEEPTGSAATPVDSSTPDTTIDDSAPATTTVSSGSAVTVTSDDKKVSVKIPAGAMLDGSTCTLSSTSVDTPPVIASDIIGSYSMDCSDPYGNTITSFTTNATFTMSVPKSTLLTSYKYYAYTQNGSGWDNQKAQYSSKNHTLVFEMSAPTTLLAAHKSSASAVAYGITGLAGLAVLGVITALFLRVRRNLLS